MRRSWTLACAALLVGCAGLTWYLLAAGARGAEIAGVLSLVATFLLAGSARLARPHDLGDEALAAAARHLAALVRREWADTLQRLLAGGGATDPADVGYVRSELAGATGSGLVRWRSDGGTDTGSLADIGAYYAGLNRGRMVVLGAPGSGKTVLVVHLLLAWLDTVAAAGPQQGRVRVPVLLSLPAWPARGADSTDRDLSARFDDWITRHLVHTYRLPGPVAAALVTGGWVLPVLDGLDEVDAEDVGGVGPPTRASLVVRALNHDPGTGLRPVVLTCREHRYRQLVAGGGEPGAPPVLTDATAVTVQPLAAEQVTGYLAYRFPGPPTGSMPAGLDPRWRPVAAALATAPAGALAAALGTPWRLFLAVTGYHAADTRPADLVDIARTRPGDLDEHLLGRLVPAATSLHRRLDGTRYQPAEVTRGLATLARHLAGQQARGGSGTDIEINELWRAAGPRASRYLHTALAAIPALCGAVAYSVAHGRIGAVRTLLTDPSSLPFSRLFSMVSTLVVLFTVFSAALVGPSRVHRANYQRLRRLRMAEIRTLAVGYPVGLAVGLAAGLTFGLSARADGGLAVGLVAGLAVGLAITIVYGLANIVQESPQAIDRPNALLREDLAFKITFGFAGAIAGWLAYRLVKGLAHGRAGANPLFTPALERATELGYALTFGLTFGLAISVWLRFGVAGAILGRRGATPRSLRGFLDWAYSAGLLRLSGTSLQFRHIELQRWAERQP